MSADADLTGRSADAALAGRSALAVGVEGVALWAPRLPGWPVARGVLRGEAQPPEQPAPRPSPALLPATERRRAPDTVAVALEVAFAACASAGRDPAQLPSVFASAYGDLPLNHYMCETLARTPLLVSPTRFHNSVHNAAAGYWTIATGCLEPYTALSACEHSFGAGLLAAATQAVTEHVAVLYVAYDIEACGPIATMVPSRGLLGAALVLTPWPSPRSIARLVCEVRAEPSPRNSPTVGPAVALVEGNGMAGCLSVFEALAQEIPRELTQTLSGGLALRVAVTPCDAAV